MPSIVDVDNELIPQIQQHFIHNLPSHRIFETNDQSNVRIVWDGISISDNFDMSNKAREIKNALNNHNIIVTERGEVPTFWKTWLPTVIGSCISIAGIIVSVIIHSMS